MRQEEINKIKDSNKSICLDHAQFVKLRHARLKSVTKIRWNNDNRMLRIEKANDAKTLVDSDPIDLAERNILILNSKHEGHERLYEIEINQINQQIEFKKLHDVFQDTLSIKIIFVEEIGANIG